MEISGISGELVMVERHQLVKGLSVLWNALQAYREDLISEGEEMHDKEWDEICTAMAHIHEALDIKHEDID